MVRMSTPEASCCGRAAFSRQSPADMISPPTIPDPLFRQNLRRAAFTLVEMLVVMGIILLLLALMVPAFTSMRSGSDFISAANDIGSTMEQARAYAMANNTYVYVGIGEYLVTESSTTSPRTSAATASTAIGQVVLAVVASRDGTRSYDVNNPAAWSTNYGTGGTLTSIDKLHFYNNVHLVDFGTTPVTSGKMARPTVTDAQYRIFIPPNDTSHDTVTPFSWPLGKTLNAGQYNFTKVIQIDPQGVARMQTATNTDGITSYMEIDLQPTHGNVAPTTPADQNIGNQAALQLDCMTGSTRVYHP